MPKLRLSPDVSDAPLTGASGGPAGRPDTALAAARDSAWLRRQPASFRDGLTGRASLKRFPRGATIIGLEDRNAGLHFLAEGTVKVSVARADGEVVPIHVIPPFEWFGELGAATGEASIAEYRAHMACTVLVVSRGDFRSLVEAHESHRAAVTELLARALRRNFDLASGLTGLKPEARVRAKLHLLASSSYTDRQGRSVISISQEDLAVVSCVSRSVVSKVVAQLVEAGAIRTAYRRIIIADRNRLLASA